MTITSERQKILDKVVKLLALAEGTNQSAEADSARNMAAELLAKYNLTLSDIVPESEFTVKREDLTRQKMRPYDATLYNSISRFNGCALIHHTGLKVGAISFVGRKSDIEAAEYMLTIVLQQRSISWKKTPGNSSAYRREWMQGYAFGVAGKLKELKDLAASKVREWGLVPVDPYALSIDWYKGSNRVTTTKSRGRAYSAAGYAAGTQVSLHKGVSAQNSVKRLS